MIAMPDRQFSRLQSSAAQRVSMGLTDLEMIPETGAVFTVGRSRFADNVASHFFIRKDPVVSISCGDEHSAVICQTGRLFVFGSNDWGQLGLGHKNHVTKPSCVKALKPEKVTHVACGRAHTLICTGAQKIFACGSDQEGQLGRGTSAIGDFTSSPVLVYDSGVAGPRIVQIAAGSHHSLALTSDGGVFSWGSNFEGQLGLPDVSGLVNKPTKVHVPEPVKQISAGYYHSTFLTESGLVYVCGETESGKLGIDVSFSTQVAPKQMQLPTSAKLVASGGHHTVVLAGNGNLYCTGSNSSGQLGLGTNATELHAPKLLPRGALQNETITRISCGESHTAIVTESGKLFTCGDGRHGKLGLEENENNVHELTFVPRYKELIVLNVACGGLHTILVGQKRETSHTQKDVENAQMEHIGKRNALPPLKTHISRVQNETRNENINEIMKDKMNEKNSTETTISVQPTLEKVPERIKENNNEDITNDVTDSMKNIKKNDSFEKNSQKTPEQSPEKNSKETSEKSSEEMSQGISSDTTTNEMKMEETSNEKTPASKEESQENSKDQNGNQEPTEDDKNEETKMDEENNVQEEHKSETTSNEQNITEKNNASSPEVKKNDVENNEINNEENDDAKSKDRTDNKQSSNEDIEVSSMKEQTESNNDGNMKEEGSPEKQMSPTSITPPPKPPRLKTGSGNSSNERTLSIEEEDENANVDNEAKNEDVSDEAETTEKKNSAKNESGSAKSSSKTGSVKSAKSRDEETIEIDNQNEKNEEEKEEKNMNNDNIQNDADVVQALPPKVGRMSKIFKSKKPQMIENGTKITDNINHKPKSKTCNIL